MKKNKFIEFIESATEMSSDIHKLSEEELLEVCNAFRQFNISFERSLSKRLTNGKVFSIDLRRGLQNKQFMLDLIPRLQAWLSMQPLYSKFEVLDVGPSWAIGTNFLGGLYKNSALGYELDITALDIRRIYLPYIKAFCPNIKYKIQNLFNTKTAYDIVICSHVIEHVPEPKLFVDKLVDIARHRVFLVAPYNEQEPMATNHRNTFDDAFLSSVNALNIDIMSSPGWGRGSKQMFIAELAGKSK